MTLKTVQREEREEIRATYEKGRWNVAVVVEEWDHEEGKEPVLVKTRPPHRKVIDMTAEFPADETPDESGKKPSEKHKAFVQSEINALVQKVVPDAVLKQELMLQEKDADLEVTRRDRDDLKARIEELKADKQRLQETVSQKDVRIQKLLDKAGEMQAELDALKAAQA